MSLRITGTGQRLTRFTSLPTSYANFTITGFAKLLVAHPTYSAHLLYTQTATINGQNHSTIVAVEGVTGRELKASDSWGANQSSVVSQVPVGGAAGQGWFFFALVGRSNGLAGHEIWYSVDPSTGSWTTCFNTPGSGFPMERLDVGSAIWSPGQWGVEDWWFDGLFAHLTVYNRALSIAEVAAQFGRATPASSDGLLSYHSFDGASVASILDPQQGSGAFFASSPSPSVSTDMPSFGPSTPVIEGGDTLPSTSSALSVLAVASAEHAVSLLTGVRFSATSTAAAAPVVTLTNSIRFAATPSASASATVALTNAIRLAAAATASATGLSAFTSGVLFAASASASATPSVDFTTSVRLAATPTATAVGNVAFVTSVQFSATSVNAAFATVTLQVGVRLAATAVGTVAPIAPLTTSIRLNASVSASATRSAALTSQIRLAADAVGTANGLAAFVSETRFAAAVSATATANAALTNSIQFATSVTSTALVQATFTASPTFFAVGSATNVATAALATGISLVASGNVAATSSAQLLSSPTSSAPPMTVYQGTCNSFKSELLRGIHNFTPATGDTFKMALYLVSASLGANTTTYTTQHETSGPGYVAGGIVLAPTVSEVEGVGIVDFADANFGTVSLNYRYAMIYNATKANRAIAVFDFGGTFTVNEGNLTLQMPPPTPTNAAIRIV